MQEASKDVVDLVKDMLSHPTLSQTSESIQGVPRVEEENKTPDGFEFSFSENIPTSKLRDSTRSISSFTMPVMMTNTTSLEEQVSTIAHTLEELNKVHERKGSIERHTNNFLDG